MSHRGDCLCLRNQFQLSAVSESLDFRIAFYFSRELHVFFVNSKIFCHSVLQRIASLYTFSPTRSHKAIFLLAFRANQIIQVNKKDIRAKIYHTIKLRTILTFSIKHNLQRIYMYLFHNNLPQSVHSESSPAIDP